LINGRTVMASEDWCELSGEAKTNEYVTLRQRAARGFSLVEVLFVVLIMGIVVGVVSSLMLGFVGNFEMTDDQSLARRRAQDVFNILQVPILNAGLGLPADDGTSGAPPVNNMYYFGTVNGKAAPISEWHGPVQVISNDFGRGDALRLVYSVFAGVKQVSDEDIITFGGPPSGVKSTTLRITDPLRAGYDGITPSVGESSRSVHSYIAFPGMGLHPLLVTGTGPDTIDVAGLTPRTVTVPSEDVVEKGVIRPYHDVHFVRAGVAYVDDQSTFCFADITTSDIPPGSLPRASALTGAAYRVEGIAAMRVERPLDVYNGAIRSLTVYVVAEGDSNVTGREGNEGSASQEFRAHYPGVTFNPEMHYEEFVMRLRTRNVEYPEK
jgi:prepilin-type N-terminal cleavage/methylation domain-containing protein